MIEEMEETARTLMRNFKQDSYLLEKNNQNISGMSYLIWTLSQLPESPEKLNAIRIACECLFTLGYQAALQDSTPDNEVWKI